MSLETIESLQQSLEVSEGVTLGRFIPAETLKIPSNEPAGVALGHAQVDVARKEIEGGVEYSATFQHPPLQGDALFSFLKHIAPESRFDSVYGVHDDWLLPDAEDRRGVFQGSQGDELLKMHVEALGQHWEDFEPSRHDLMDAIVSGYDPTPLLRFFKCKQIALYEEPELRQQLQAAKLDFPMLRRMFHGEDFPDPTTTIAGYMLADGSINEKTHSLILKGSRKQTISTIFDQDREDYRGRYLAEMSEDQTEAAFKNYLEDQYIELVIEDGGQRYVYKSHAYGVEQKALQAAYDGRQPFKIKKGSRYSLTPKPSSYVIDRAVLDTKHGPKEVVFPHTLRPSDDSVAIQPVLQWRTFKPADGVVKREVMVDEQSQRPESQRVDEPRIEASRLAGLLALAYISPDLIKDWPKSIKLGDRNPQEMGAAQVPVLALMKRNSLLRSPAIELMESLA